MLTDLLLTSLLLTAQAPTTPPPAPPQTPTASSTHARVGVEAEAPTLAEPLTLKVENHLLRLRVVQLESQLQAEALSRQRTEIEAAIAASHEGWTMDWATGQLTQAKAAAPTETRPPAPQP